MIRSKLESLAVVGLLCSAATPALAADNPMDAAGIQHNMYLGCLHDTGPYVSAEDSLVRVVKQCGLKIDTPLDAFVKANVAIVDSDPTQTLAEKMAPARKQYTDYEFSFFSRIDEVARKSQDAAEADAMFAALEEEAIARLDPRGKAGATVLGSLSVARHSLRYWNEREGASGGSAQKRKWWHILLIVVSDVAGFAASIEIGPAAAGVAGAASETANELLHIVDP